MKVLVIGGSYFLGKYYVYTMMNGADITVFNRGNVPFNMEKLTEIKGDRHNEADLQKLADCQFDVVVDFCAYSRGDIESVANVLPGIKQYIFVSTVDVYKRGLGQCLDETAPLEDRDFGGEAGAYITGKVALEEEIKNVSVAESFAYTVIRPAFIYGPGNYAPRESLYIGWIRQANQIIHPVDATGEFQFGYVKDVADAIAAATGNEKAYNQAFNVANPKMITYDSYADALQEAAGQDFERVPVTIDVVNERQIPLPFPMTKAESNCYNGSKGLELIERYTELEEGLKITISMM